MRNPNQKYVINFTRSSELTNTEVKVYELMGWLENIGGMQGSILLIFQFLTSGFAGSMYFRDIITRNFKVAKKNAKDRNTVEATGKFSGLLHRLGQGDLKFTKCEAWIKAFLCRSLISRSKDKLLDKGADRLESYTDIE